MKINLKRPIGNFEDLNVYQNSYQASIEIMTKIIPKLPIIEKNDLKDQIEKRIIRDCIKKLKHEFLLAEISYFSTSALNGQNISDALRAIGRILLRTPLIDLYEKVIIAK